MLFPEISAKNVNSWYPYKQFLPKIPDSAMKPSSKYAIVIVYQYAFKILMVFSFVGAKLHFRFHKLSAFWHASLLNKLCQIFER